MQELIFYLVVFATNVIQGITGFAGTLLAMPVSMLLVGMEPAKVALNFFGFCRVFFSAVQNKNDIVWREVAKMALWMGAGMGLGFLLDTLFSAAGLLPIYGVFLVALGAVRLAQLLLQKNSRPAARLPLWVGIGTLIASGTIHALYVSGGALLVVYASTVLADKRQFRATLAPVWVLLNGFLLAGQVTAGQFSGDTLRYAMLGLAPMALGILLGGKLHRKLQPRPFFILTFLLIVLSGILILVR